MNTSIIYENTRYKYYAFISYKRTDSKWADWLYHTLQSYRLPSKLCKKYCDLTKRFHPIYMDKEDLLSGNLGDRLKADIAQCKFFISVCSKNVRTNPQYIDMELQYFLETHNNDYTKVIPFIVDASAEPEKECFSPKMQELCAKHHLVGVNIHEKGKHRAFLKVIAQMHGISTSEIESFDDLRRRKNTILASLCGIAIVCAAAFGIHYWWQHFAVHTEYFTSYVWENNVVQGIRKIPKPELDSYARYYCIESIDHQVRSITHKNYAGTIVPVDEATVLNLGASKIEFLYTGEKQKYMYMAKYYDHNLLPLVCYQYSADGTHVTLLQNEASGIPSYVSQGLGIQEMDDGPRTNHDSIFISRYIQEFDSNGRLSRRYYAYGEDYCKTSDGKGIFGYDLRYDESGNLAEVAYFSTSDGTVAGETDGIASVKYKYDAFSRILNVSYFDLNDQLVNGVEKWAEKEYIWHENNNIAKTSYKEKDGIPATVNGYSTAEHTYSSNRLVRTTYFDASGKITVSDNGYAFVTYKTNDIGEIISFRYWNADNSPAIDKNSGTYGYDIYKTDVRKQYMVYVDENGDPMQTLDGYAYAYITFDDYNYPVRIEYRDQNNKPRSQPYAINTYVYDEIYHSVKAWSFFDENEVPVTNPELGFASVITGYDNRGFMTQLEYRDSQGELCFGPNGYAKMKASRILDGTYTTEVAMFYGADGTPVINETISAYGYDCAYYENGRLAGIVYLDKDERPYYNPKMGFAGVNYLYDEYGYIRYVNYIGNNMQNIMVDGFSSMSQSQDQHGNVLSRQFFDEFGNAVVNENEGYAGMIINYDNGNLSEIHYFGPDGKYMNHLEKGYAAIAFIVDGNGRLTIGGIWQAKDGELVRIE